MPLGSQGRSRAVRRHQLLRELGGAAKRVTHRAFGPVPGDVGCGGTAKAPRRSRGLAFGACQGPFDRSDLCAELLGDGDALEAASILTDSAPSSVSKPAMFRRGMVACASASTTTAFATVRASRIAQLSDGPALRLGAGQRASSRSLAAAATSWCSMNPRAASGSATPTVIAQRSERTGEIALHSVGHRDVSFEEGNSAVPGIDEEELRASSSSSARVSTLSDLAAHGGRARSAVARVCDRRARARRRRCRGRPWSGVHR